MRLFLVDSDGSEVTKVNFTEVRSKRGTGGQCAFSLHDSQMALTGTAKKLLNQRIEIRENDGTTVLWEGIATDVDYDSRWTQWVCAGPEGLRALDEVNVDYDGDKGNGVITAIDDDDTPPTITDKNQTFSADLVGYEVLFTNQNKPSIEEQFPDSNTAFYGHADSTSGTYTDLAAGGTAGMSLTDAQGDAADTHGIELQFTFAQYATAQQLTILIKTGRQYRSYYAENGSDNVLIQVYDVGETAWQTTDGNGVAGMGRKSTGWGKYGGQTNANLDEVVTIDDTDIASYFDGSGVLKIRVSAGGLLAQNFLKITLAKASLTYANLYAPEATIYTIDAVSGSDLTFTGQTPFADGITVGDTFRIGEDVDTIITKAWRNGLVDWIDYETDGTTGIVDCTNIKGAKLGSLLRRYMDTINWKIWQEIGWNIRMGVTYDSTGLSLTDTSFKWFTFGMRGRQVIRRLSVFSVGFYQGIVQNVVDGLQGLFDKVVNTWNQNTQSATAQTIDNTMTKYQTLNFRFHGELDMGLGVDYSAIGVGKEIDIDLYTDKVNIAAGVIDEISYMQRHGGHLTATIKVEIGQS